MKTGTVVKMVDDWVPVTRGEEWAVISNYDSPSWGRCVEMALIERRPEGGVVLTERRAVPVNFVRETGEVIDRLTEGL